jgi:uncharacterized membrane protein YraQ (UPF0718 family)
MTALIASLLAIAVAPALSAGLTGRPRATAFVDGMVQVVVGGILLVHVLPAGLVSAGWPALLALAAGALGAAALHRAPGGERSAAWFAASALLLHSGLDGAALGAPDDDHGGHTGAGLLAWAVALHTVPVALATWRIAGARAGKNAAIFLLVGSALATTGGWWAADTVLHEAPPRWLAVAQCLGAGALLHVLGHVGESGPRRPAGWGALAGAGVIALLTAAHPIPHIALAELSPRGALSALVLVSAPPLLLGYLATGVLRRALGGLPLGAGSRGPGGIVSALRGAFSGFALPVQTCGALPAWRQLLGRGAPVEAGLAFLVAGPGVGVATLLLSLALLGPALTLTRVVATLILGVGVGLYATDTARARAPGAISGLPPRSTNAAAARFALVDTVDHTAPWVLAGIGLAALAEPLLPVDAFSRLPPLAGVLLATTLGLPAYVCAAGATPLVAVLLHKGLSAGSALAFLLAGAATNMTALRSLRAQHGPDVARRYLLGLAVGVVVLGLAVDMAWPRPIPVPALHDRADGIPSEWISVALVIGLFSASLVRNGAAGFLEPLLHPHRHDHTEGSGGPTAGSGAEHSHRDHDHIHDPGHGPRGHTHDHSHLHHR